MVVFVIFAAIILVGLGYEFLGEWRDSRRFPPPGRMFELSGCKIHLNQQGTGGPAVILESGIAASSLSWLHVQPRVAEFTTVCSYDRAGLGWSTGSYKPNAPEEIVSRLHQLLQLSGVAPPYILVGHSFGGLVIRAFAHVYGAEVAGLVFVDPVSVETWAQCSPQDERRLDRGATLSLRGAWLARFGIVRATLAILAKGGRRFPSLMAQTTAKQGAAMMARLAGEVRKLPPSAWPIVRAHWSKPKAFRAMAAQLRSLPVCAQAVSAMPLSPHLPFIVLSAGDATDHEISERESWVNQSRCGRHTRVAGTKHWLHLERPDIVVSAVRELSQLH